ncbi:MAG TPA: DNA polymerase/3'-5' exonuclease PolX [Bacillota bacterium]|nr:DNA polymerase/3'-5' exonuclease PolX [Bacillota bacterium]
MDKQELVQILNEIGLLLELKGENPFKIKAYYQAARTLDALTDDLETLIREGRVGELPGFGEALVQKVDEWYRTGTVQYYENLKADIPPGLIDMLRVPGLGAKKVSVLYQTLGIAGLDQLEAACRENRLVALSGFGAKTQLKILAGIEFIKEHSREFLLADAWQQAISLLQMLTEEPDVVQVEIAGSLRRFKETVKDIDLVASSEHPESLIRRFSRYTGIQHVVSSGPTKVSVILESGLGCDLRVVAPCEFVHTLQHFTGSKEHNTALRHRAKEWGYKVNEYGLFRGDTPEYCETEAEIYQKLGLEWIPPELREDRGEIEAAHQGRLPKLIEPEDLLGIFHMHTNASDGTASLRQMVEQAIAMGYSYLGIADHSQSAVYAHGLTPERLVRQFEEIDRLNAEYPGFKIFKGIEADILPDGRLDYDDELLAQCDFVIGSIHSRFKMDKAEMTSRVLRAMENPYLTILGHPTGRILLQRPEYPLDMDAVLAQAARCGVILEFNANPNRLDLDWRWCRKAKELGVLISINPDAHSTRDLNLARLYLMVARKGWLEKTDVFNTRSAVEVESYFKNRVCR